MSRGPRVDPRSPEYAWISRVVAAVERRAGAPTRWNGHLHQVLDPDALGVAHADGAMSLNVADVFEPVRRVFESREPFAADLRAARDALATVVHEAAHLSTNDGDPDLPGAYPAGDAAGEALDEGLTENWTHDSLDRIIHDIGMDRAVPGILDAPTTDTYPACSAAARELVDGVARIAGEPRERVADLIRNTDLSQRWNVIADLAIDHHLADSTSDHDRSTIRQRLAEGLRGDFAGVLDIESDLRLTVASRAQQGLRAGRLAADNLRLETERLRAGGPPGTEFATARPAAHHRVSVGRPDVGSDHFRRVFGGLAPAADAPRASPATTVGAAQAVHGSHRATDAGRLR